MDGEGIVEGPGSSGSSSSDSGMMRSSIGWEVDRWMPAPVPEGPPANDDVSFLGRPRAAAAQERRVVREARRAASLSAWEKPGPGAPRLGRVCERWDMGGRP